MHKLKALFKTRLGRKYLTVVSVSILVPVLVAIVVISSNTFVNISEEAQTIPTIDTTNKTKASVMEQVDQVIGGWFEPKDTSGVEDEAEPTGQVTSAEEASNANPSTYEPSQVQVSTADTPTSIGSITDSDIIKDIQDGLYTEEDYNYLVALGQESSSYEGFYAVASLVRNRVKRNGTSYKAEITAPNQFAGYNQNEVGNPRNEDVKRAAVAILRGGESSVGDSYFFFGRSRGYDLWAEPDCPEFYNMGNNIYYDNWGQVHNRVSNKTAGAIIIYDCTSNVWVYPSGTYYKR